MQLKAIRLMLSENGRLSVPQEIVREAQSMLEKGDAGAAAVQQEHAQCAFTSDNSDTLHSQHALPTGGADTVENILLDERSSKAAKLQYLLENLVSRAVQESNETVLKELDYRFRQMEENAQEREPEADGAGRGALSEAGRAALPERKKKGQTETVEGRERFVPAHT